MLWDKVDPILRATYSLIDENEATGRTTGEAVCAALGVAAADDDTAAAVIRQLDSTGYIKVESNAGGTAFFIEPTAAGLEHCSGWPTPGHAPVFVEELLNAITE